MITFATLVAGVFWIAAPLASAQPAARTLDVAEVATGEGRWEVDPPAPAGEAQPTRPPGFPKIVLLDTGHVLTSPIRWRGREWAAFSASVGALAVLSLADESISDAAREHGPTLGFAGDTLEGLGDGRSFLLLGGFYLAGAIGHDSKAKNVFFDGLSASLIASGIITPVLSSLVGRERPTAEQGAYSFHPFEGRSFPSGHATQAFAVASVIATSYDQAWVKVAAYGAASVGAYARVRRGKHFLTDVVAGAAIGTLVGRSVVHLNNRLRSGEKEPERTGIRLSVLPFVDGTTFGATASLDF
ncbi:MAG TPA: phosphatase PAP2 family protein [Thermoanaerobaculia bacterium]